MAKPTKKYSNLEIREIEYIKNKFGITKIQDIDVKILKDFKEKLKILKDSRYKNMVVYKLWDVVICVIMASFANNNTWKEIHTFIVDNYKWFKSFLQMTGGIPKPETIERIIGIVDKNTLNDLLKNFFEAITLTPSSTENEVLNIDGRINNGSKRENTFMNKGTKGLNCLNMYSNKLGYCIVSEQIDDKTNEIPTIEQIIPTMNLSDTIVTWDALNTQTKNVKAVIGASGDYIVPVKGNHKDMYQNLIDYFDQDRCDEIRAGSSNGGYYRLIEKSHSSTIIYEIFQTSDIDWYDRKEEWMGLKTFGMVKKTITKLNKVENKRKNAKKKTIEKVTTNVENRYYISSRMVNAKEFYEITRKHWNVENKIHWHLDVTFCQDKNTTTNKGALLNLEIIHKFCLACLEKTKSKYKNSLKGYVGTYLTILKNSFQSFCVI